MALQMDVTTPDGVTYPAAYLYAPVVVATPDTVTISLNWYADRSEWEQALIPFRQTGHSLATADWPLEPLFEAAYAHLLTLPEFATAVEVP